jgi:hypothetical protein
VSVPAGSSTRPLSLETLILLFPSLLSLQML